MSERAGVEATLAAKGGQWREARGEGMRRVIGGEGRRDE